MEIRYASIFVNDQDKALKFYTEILGFEKKDDVSEDGYRWLSVVSPENPEGAELLLEPNNNPASETYQKAIFEQDIPATSFVVTDVGKEFERLKKLGVKFTQEPIEVMPNVTYAVFNDTVGNLIQIQKTP